MNMNDATLIDRLKIEDIELPEPEFASSYQPNKGKTYLTQRYGNKSHFVIMGYNWDIDEDWKAIAQEQLERANDLHKARAEYKYKYDSLVMQLRKAKVIGKPCPRCGSFKMDRDSSINYVPDMGHASNSYENCTKCGHFAEFGPRW